MTKALIIQPGSSLVLDVLTWQEPTWQFDSPSLILRQTIEFEFEFYPDPERVAENYVIDACVRGYVVDQDDSDSLRRDGFNLNSLRRRFREATRGMQFPLKSYRATRWLLDFFEVDGRLEFEYSLLDEDPK